MSEIPLLLIVWLLMAMALIGYVALRISRGAGIPKQYPKSLLYPFISNQGEGFWHGWRAWPNEPVSAGLWRRVGSIGSLLVVCGVLLLLAGLVVPATLDRPVVVGLLLGITQVLGGSLCVLANTRLRKNVPAQPNHSQKARRP